MKIDFAKIHFAGSPLDTRFLFVLVVAIQQTKMAKSISLYGSELRSCRRSIQFYRGFLLNAIGFLLQRMNLTLMLQLYTVPDSPANDRRVGIFVIKAEHFSTIDQGSHPAIIEPDEFDSVQAEIERRKNLGRPVNSNSPFSAKIVCGECGGYFGAKVCPKNRVYILPLSSKRVLRICTVCCIGFLHF